MNQERELPGLAGIGAFVTWCEELLALLSGPLVTAGLLIGLMALLTDGQLLVEVPALLWVWAGAMALGLDAQFIGSAAKLARAIRRRAGWAIVGYIVLCAALGYVAFVASDVFSVQEANGISTAEALARLGMDNTTWIFQRSLLAVTLVFLSGFLRYVAPVADVALSAEAERVQLEAALMLEPLRAQKRAQQVRGLRSVVAAAAGREEVPPRPPTGGGTPRQAQPAATEVITPTPERAANIVPMTAPRKRLAARPQKRQVARNRVSVEDRARRAYQPGMSASALARAAHIGKSAASKWRTVLEAEAQQAAQ